MSAHVPSATEVDACADNGKPMTMPSPEPTLTVRSLGKTSLPLWTVASRVTSDPTILLTKSSVPEKLCTIIAAWDTGPEGTSRMIEVATTATCSSGNDCTTMMCAAWDCQGWDGGLGSTKCNSIGAPLVKWSLQGKIISLRHHWLSASNRTTFGESLKCITIPWTNQTSTYITGPSSECSRNAFLSKTSCSWLSQSGGYSTAAGCAELEGVIGLSTEWGSAGNPGTFGLLNTAPPIAARSSWRNCWSDMESNSGTLTRIPLLTRNLSALPVRTCRVWSGRMAMLPIHSKHSLSSLSGGHISEYPSSRVKELILSLSETTNAMDPCLP